MGGRWLPLVGVLSIAKLRVGQEAYQLSGVAESLDAYYTGAGEAEGVWFGGGAARLGLDGQVQPDDLRAVLAGCRPGAGGLTPNGEPLRSHPRRVPGFDLTFKVPKSASVLYAVSDDPRVQGVIVDAGEVAIREAIGWLEREAIEVQRGSHNQAWLARQSDPSAGPRRLGTHGVVVAGFRHRTSRAGDPLLHWHCLVANLVEGTDGKWSAFAHPDLYRYARLAPPLTVVQLQRRVPRTNQRHPGLRVTLEPSSDAVQQLPVEHSSERVSAVTDAIELLRFDRCEAGRTSPPHPIPRPIQQQRQPMTNRHRTIDPRLSDDQSELRQQQLATVAVSTAPRTRQRRGRHREHQRRHIDPLTDRQQIVDEHVRLDPDAAHPRHHLRRRRTPRQVPASPPFLRDAVPSTPPELPFEPIRQVHAQHREDRTSQECSPRCSSDTSPHPSSATDRSRADTQREM